MILREIFDDDVLVAEADPSVYSPSVHPEEVEAVARAVLKRQREFIAARGLARELHLRLGVDDGPLLNGEDRAPRFPAGAVGTITHTAGFCGVAVARDSLYLGLGADVEQAAPLDPKLLRLILAEDELEAYEPSSEADMVRAKLVFGAKEAAYKAQYALTRTFLGFSAMRIEVDDAKGSFRAFFRQPVGEIFEPGDILEGRFIRRDGLVASAVAIRRDGPYARL